MLILASSNTYNQTISDLYNLVSDKKDKKAIEGAEKEIEEAGKLVQEANKYYNEALELQTNYEFDEKTLQKKLEKAEKSAVDNQLKADKLYASAYKSIFEVCQKQVSSAGETAGDSYRRSAEDLMEKAKIKRKDAEYTKSVYEKAALLNDAAGLENAAIENMILALQGGSGVQPSYTEDVSSGMIEYPEPIEGTYTYQEPTTTGTVTQVSEDLALDQNVINKYDSYVSDPSIPDPVMVNTYGVTGVADVSVDVARDYLYEYQTGDVSDYAYTQEQYAIEDTISSMVGTETTAYTGTEYSEIAYESTISESEGTQVSTEPAYNTREEMDVFSSVQSEGVRFSVQIAASRAPLSRPQIEAIFKGNETVEVLTDGNWIKYRITGFRLFSDANRVALNSGVRDAWVMAMDKGNTVNLVEAREMTRVMEADVKRRGRQSITNETDFYVQLAAARMRYTDQRIESLCNTYGACREIVEEGWFKYQIYVGPDYNKAVLIKNNIGGQSFVVGYQQGKKVKLYKAIHKTK